MANSRADGPANDWPNASSWSEIAAAAEIRLAEWLMTRRQARAQRDRSGLNSQDDVQTPNAMGDAPLRSD